MSDSFCTLYIVRHAQSEANAAGILGGNYPLTELGKEQATVLGKEFADIPFDHVYASDAIRARQTAEILLQGRNTSVETSEDLRERSFGMYEGRLLSEVSDELGNWDSMIAQMSKDERFNHHDGGGIENDASLIGRYFNFLRDISLANLGRNVLIVSHSNAMRTILVQLGFATMNEMPRGTVENTAYIKVLSDGLDFEISQTEGIHKKVV